MDNLISTFACRVRLRDLELTVLDDEIQLSQHLRLYQIPEAALDMESLRLSRIPRTKFANYCAKKGKRMGPSTRFVESKENFK
jgi:hypothetical protein